MPLTQTGGSTSLRRLLHRVALIAIGITALAGRGFPGALVLDPGGPPSGLPTPTLRIVKHAHGAAILFSLPGILQRSTDLAAGDWEGVAMASPYLLEPDGLTGNAFYRVVAAERPVIVRVPENYDPTVPAPLFIGLHGRGGTGLRQEAFFDFGGEFEARGIVSCWPTGSEVSSPGYAWSSVEGEPDSSYLRTLIGDVQQQLNIDPSRIFVFGYSNGGRMALRMGCDQADTVAAVVSLSGALYLVYEPAGCATSKPVNFLHIHGTQDPVVDYARSMATLEQWVAAKGCGERLEETEPTLNLVDGSALETKVTQYPDCAGGTDTELWTVVGGTHDSVLTDEFRRRVVDWLLAHPKP